MLGEALVKLVGFFAKSLGGGLAAVAPSTMIPLFIPDAIEQWAEIVAGIGEMAHWLPLGAIAQVFIGLVFAQTLALGIRVTRIILSAGIGGGG